MPEDAAGRPGAPVPAVSGREDRRIPEKLAPRSDGGRTVRYRIVVTGRVQGVWFRESCRQHAERLGVAGWVRNRADGAVEIEAEGAEASVAQLVSWCRLGPPAAEVDGIELDELTPTGHRGFSVR